tara:strand:- start:306 stop:536 length:231 start_codon:yes stop_codon:yes gene_type:complete
MAQTDRPAPRLPEPPENIDKRYLEDLVRTLQSFITEERSTSAIRGTTLTLTSLPTSATGLAVGTIYNDSGTIKIKT